MEPGKDYPTAWGGHPATPGMTAEEQYIFDLSGVSSPASASDSAALRHRSTVAACVRRLTLSLPLPLLLLQFVVIRNCLTPDEVAACNAAIDRHAHLITRPPDSYSHGSSTLRGENNLITKLARALGGDDLGAAGDRMVAAYEQARGGDDITVTLGRLREALAAAAPDKAAALGAVAEQAVDTQHLPQDEGCVGEERVVQLGTSRGDLDGMLQWEQPDCEPFR
eukprot:COSAG06_NODE_4700_length_4026_cov_2.671505_3_plen_223_part_00